MLLRLTLALLWSTCLAAQMYGRGGGKYFSTPRDHEYEITGIRVAVGSLGILKSIQVRYGPSWTTVSGCPSSGTPQEFILYPGERIIGISGSYQMYLRSLNLYTDKMRYATFGKDDGNYFFVYPDQFEKVLTGICGQCKLLGITGLCFAWDYPLEFWDTIRQNNSTSSHE
ncbi:zymogen granule protein 16 homolog B [Lynx canadensis]|uniref:zymogen granule protein 16 homolog B n=1 Tax=Lynx canadensis TaxID=61383 RepID=UPI0011AFFAC6|nr:zymogen granule protein 16 homolog B [Lynx canadensis]